MKNIISVPLNSRVGESKFFFWYEFLCLPQWQIFCFPSKKQVKNLELMALVMDRLREILGGHAITVTSGLRPHFYNIFIRGSKRSRHRLGLAIDFTHATMTADRVREILLPYLEELGICMEDLPGSNWVHIDSGAPRKYGGRFFKP